MFSRNRSICTCVLFAALIAVLCAAPAAAQTLPALSVSPAALTFYYQIGSTAPAAQTLDVASSPSAVTYTGSATTANGGSWLSVAPTVPWITPGKLGVSVNPTGLTAGTYNGTVIVASAGASNTPVNVPVTLTVSTNPLLIVSQTSLSFNYQRGDPVPAAQTLSVSSSGAPMDFTISHSTDTGVPWLNVATSASRTDATVTVSINPAFAPTGNQIGTIRISSAGASNSPVTVTVNLVVSEPPTFNVSPGLLTFNYQVGAAAPAEQTLDVVATKTDLPFTVSSSTASGGNWLSVSPTAWPTTPSKLSVRVTPGELAAGTYSGTITVSMPGASNTPQTVAVTLVIAASPVMSVSPGSLSFYYQVGSTAMPDPQTFMVSSSGTALSYTATALTGAGGNWLSATPGSGSTPGAVTVAVNPGALAIGTYTGTVSLESAGASNSPQTVAVTLVVSATPLLSVAPNTLAFNYQVNAQVPAAQVLTVKSSGTQLASIATVATASGGNWLAVSPAVSTTPGALSVSVNPVGLPVGNYTGTVTISAPGASNTPQNVAVTMVVSTSPFLSVSQPSLTFNYQVGGAAPAAQPLTVSGTSNAMSYTVTPTTASGGNWLAVNPATGATASVVNVSVNATGLLPGTYTGSLSIASAGAVNTPQTVPVTLIVTDTPVLNIAPTSLSFSYQSGAAAPAAQTLALASSAGSLNYVSSATTASGGNWLAVTPTSGATPGSLSVSVNPVGLLPGTYEGSVTVMAAGQSAPQIVPVTFTILAGLTMSASPASLTFYHQINTTPPGAQTLKVTSSGTAFNFSASVSTASGGNWLAATPSSSSTPGTLTVSINPAGLALGTYNGTITLTSSAALNSPLAVPVVLVISANPFLKANASALTFAAATGGALPAAQDVVISSTGAALTITTAAATTSGGSWLSATPGAGLTPVTVNVAVNSTGLPVGTYTGQVLVSSTGVSNSPLAIPVTLTVNASVNLASTPAALNFSYQVGSAAPAAQNLAISASGASLNFSATTATNTGGGWLAVSPSGAVTPGTLSVSVNPASLAPGTYTGNVMVSSAGATNSPFSIPVTLVVTSGVNLSLAPGSLAFGYQIGGPAPASQNLAVSSGGTPLSFTTTAATTSGGSWLSVSPSGGGTTPATLAVSIVTAGLAAGTYSGTITVAAPQAANTPQVVNVTLTVSAATAPLVSAVVNGASWLAGPISPGEVLTIGGTTVGPDTLTKYQLDANGKFPTKLADTAFYFDNIAAPIIYVSKTQSSVIVPYGIYGRTEVQLEVEYKGVRSDVIKLKVADAAPGIFSTGANGIGQGAILNQDYSINGAANAAARNSVVMIYATGEGQTNPPGVDGALVGATLPQSILKATVTIGGKAAEVQYSGGAPGNVAGLWQINAKVPADAATGGAVPVVVTIGGVSSQSTITMAVK
jgi:uncharacterized protein (TIGR03437 family)